MVTAWPTSSCSLESAVLINSGHPRLSFNSNCETANTTVDDRQALSNIRTTATYRPKSREEVLVAVATQIHLPATGGVSDLLKL
jgi:hypothetical protein